MDLEARSRQELRERLRRGRRDEGVVPPREDERRGADPRRAVARVVPEAGVGLGGEAARRRRRGEGEGGQDPLDDIACSESQFLGRGLVPRRGRVGNPS